MVLALLIGAMTSPARASAAWHPPTTLFVDPDAAAGGDGESWNTAFRHLQDALAAAEAPGSFVVEIRVAEGSYRPDRSDAHPEGTLDRKASFVLPPNVDIRGGFAGLGSSDPDARDPAMFVSVLTGDYLGNDKPNAVGIAENAEKIVRGGATPGLYVIDGFTITGGNSIPSASLPEADAIGAGILATTGTLHARDCTIRGCYAFNETAMRANGAIARVERCLIEENTATSATGVVAGLFSGFVVIDSTFHANHGSGLSASGAGATNMVLGCTFSENGTPFATGGALRAGVTNILVAECLFVDNLAKIGGAMSLVNGVNARIIDSTFVMNRATDMAGALFAPTSGQLRVERCEFTKNLVTALGGDGGALMLSAAAPWSILDSAFIENGTFGAAGAISAGQMAAGTGAGERRIARCSFLANRAARGGAIEVVEGGCSIEGCDFVGNRSLAVIGFNESIGGGAISCRTTTLASAIANCRFVGNLSEARGGALHVRHEGSQPAVTVFRNLSMAANQASITGGAIHFETAAPTLLENLVVWGNAAPAAGLASQIAGLTSAATLTHSCVQFLDGSVGGSDNTSLDPLFQNAAGPDGSAGTADDDLRLTPRSPCRDFGVPAPAPACGLDLDGSLRSAGLAPDAGAYESFSAPGADCDRDGRHDPCATGAGVVADCNANGTPDVCEASAIEHDCNADAQFDGCQPLADCDDDGLPDVCAIRQGEADCNANGLPDSCELASGTAHDCNGNGAPDECDIAGGHSLDTNADGIPDECADCDGDGILDIDEIREGASDCNLDGIPDECQLTGQGGLGDCDDNGVPDACDPDCDGNGVPDACDIAEGTLRDLDGNGVPDVCQPDCNANGLPDFIEILFGTSADCDDNGVPDECDDDCDGDGIPDACEIAGGLASDCNLDGVPDACQIASGELRDFNGNGVPDACEPDCNANGLPDFLDLILGVSEDCNANDLPDECDLALGSPDCNANGIPDSCDVATGVEADCDGDGVLDSCEIADGAPDCNANGIPDACDVGLPFSYTSAQLSPFGATAAQSVLISPAYLTANVVTVNVSAVADLNTSGESVNVFLDGTLVGNLFGPSGSDCPATPDLAILSVPVATWNAKATDGVVTLNFVPTSSVNANQCSLSWVKASITHQRLGAFADANGNGIPDACEANGDLNGDGAVSAADLSILLGAWGPCPSCAADLNHDGAVGAPDIAILLGNWS